MKRLQTILKLHNHSDSQIIYLKQGTAQQGIYTELKGGMKTYGIFKRN